MVDGNIQKIIRGINETYTVTIQEMNLQKEKFISMLEYLEDIKYPATLLVATPGGKGFASGTAIIGSFSGHGDEVPWLRKFIPQPQIELHHPDEVVEIEYTGVGIESFQRTNEKIYATPYAVVNPFGGTVKEIRDLSVNRESYREYQERETSLISALKDMGLLQS